MVPGIRSSLPGRDTERSIISAAAGAAAGGKSTVLVLAGSAGSGRTAVLEAAVEDARLAGREALVAQGSPFERDNSWGVVRQLLPEASALTGPVAHSDLEGAFVHLTQLARRGPLLVAVDDVPLVDAASLRFLTYLLTRLRRVPVVLLLTAAVHQRPTDPASVSRLLDDPRARRLDLRPLGVAQVAEIAGVTDPGGAEEFHRLTGGVPGLVRRLADEVGRLAAVGRPVATAELESVIPPAVAEAVLTIAARESPAAVELARSLAVLGQATSSAAAALVGLEAESAAVAAERLVRFGLLRGGPVLSYAQPLVRAAVHAELGVDRRRRLHRLAARRLHDQQGDVAAVTSHLLQAELAGEDWVVSVLRGAARAAADRGDPRAAQALLTRAVGEPPPASLRGAVLAELAAAVAATDPAEAVTWWAEVRSAETTVHGRARATVPLVECVSWSGHGPRAHELLEEGLAEITRGPASPDLAAVRAQLLGLREMVELTEPVLRRRRGSHSGTSSASGPVEDRILPAWWGRAGSAAEAAEAIRRELLRVPAAPGSTLAALCLLPPLVWADEPELAGLHADRAVRSAAEDGSPARLALAIAVRGLAARHRGHLAAAVADGELSMRTFGVPWWGWLTCTPAVWLVDALVDVGRLDAAGDVVARWGTPPRSLVGCAALHARGRLRVRGGYVADGLRDLLECGRRLEDWGVSPAVVPWRIEAVHALVLLGDVRAAVEHADEALSAARRWGSVAGLAAALRARSEAAAGSEAVDLAAEAVTVLERSANRLELARALGRLATAMAGQGLRSAARDPLLRGLRLAEEVGAAPLVAEIQAQLAAAGAGPRPVDRSGRPALTPGERRVAAEAARGHSNALIAAALHLSQRTVEFHLTNVYRKLGIGGRPELAHALPTGPEPPQPLPSDRPPLRPGPGPDSKAG